MNMNDTPNDNSIEYLANEDGSRLAYRKIRGRSPGILFLGGFMSDMNGSKASYLANEFSQLGQSFTRFDYSGHGESSGRFEDGTIGSWKEDALKILDSVTEGPQILVGSSMGGWLMTLVARERKERIIGMVGISSAPDFTQDIMNFLTPAQKNDLENSGKCEIPSDYAEGPYVITKALIEDGQNQQVLSSPIPIYCPVRLLHGTLDKDVPWQSSLKLMESLKSLDARLTLIKDADHRLSTESNLSLIFKTILEFV